MKVHLCRRLTSSTPGFHLSLTCSLMRLVFFFSKRLSLVCCPILSSMLKCSGSISEFRLLVCCPHHHWGLHCRQVASTLSSTNVITTTGVTIVIKLPFIINKSSLLLSPPPLIAKISIVVIFFFPGSSRSSLTKSSGPSCFVQGGSQKTFNGHMSLVFI